MARRPRNVSARLRKVSRSSPKIFSAISARMPESMWSIRCAIGWPTLTEAGSTASRERISASISSRERDDGLRSTSISLKWTPSACSSSSARPVRRPTDATSGTAIRQPFGNQPEAVGFRKRDAGIVLQADVERALVEGRQKGARQQHSGHTAAATTAAPPRPRKSGRAGRWPRPEVPGWLA